MSESITINEVKSSKVNNRSIPYMIKIKYHDKEMPKIEQIKIGDWIDLRCPEEIRFYEQDFKLVPLAISMQLPEGFEAQIAPRSSLFKKHGLILVNSLGIIDNSYCGDDDIWHAGLYCLKGMQATQTTFVDSDNGDGTTTHKAINRDFSTIKKYERIVQFRIVPKMPDVKFIEVDKLGNPNRGGIGSTGSL